MDDDDGPMCAYVDCIRFATYAGLESVRLSVKEAVNPETFDMLGHPSPGGLYDMAYGSMEPNEICTTCRANFMTCEGHQGHIVLPLPCYHPMFFRQMMMILKGSCHMCKRCFSSPDPETLIAKAALRLLDLGTYVSVDELSVMCGIEPSGEVMMDEKAEDTSYATYGGKDVAQVNEILEEFIAKKRKEKSERSAAEDEGVGGCSRSGGETWLRHHEVTKQALRKNLTNMLLIKGSFRSHCPHCGAPNTSKSIRSEYHSRVYIQKLGITSIGTRKVIQLNGMEGMTGAKKDSKEGDDDKGDDKGDEEGDKGSSVPQVIEQEVSDEVLKEFCNRRYLSPQDVKSHFRALWENEQETLEAVFGMLRVARVRANVVAGEPPVCPTDIFFMDIISVPPNRFRPVSAMKGAKTEHPQTSNLRRVLQDSIDIRRLIGTKARNKALNPLDGLADVDSARIHHTWLVLQTHVNCLYDERLDKLSLDKQPGIKQIFEKKEGLFRMHMMGKRVDYAARSVISPDPYIGVHEIGIPDVFAKKLTYPECVTPWNVEDLRKAVLNGPDVHPGASFVVTETGQKVRLNGTNFQQRQALARTLLSSEQSKGDATGVPTPSSQLLPKKVYRHLRNGDYLLLNRQPTLHRPSVQAHQAHVLFGEKTLRLHYACCKAYNADFDGDEMNAHFPQNELGRAEAKTLVATQTQYLVPKDGTPLAGLIQDHIVSGVLLTLRGTFFTREEYQQLVYSALVKQTRDIKLLPPAIYKPVRLWAGKQVISTLLLNIFPENKEPLNMISKAKVSAESWITAPVNPDFDPSGRGLGFMDESRVIIRGGELLCGILDKSNYGSTAYGLIHCCYEIYGGHTASTLLSCLSRLFSTYLQGRGFTLGVKDILVTKKGDKIRNKVMKRARESGDATAARALRIPEDSSPEEIKAKFAAAQFAKDDGKLRDLDKEMGTTCAHASNDINKACLVDGLLTRFPDNNLWLLITAGAKGTPVNMLQITSLLGQIELEGKRPPLMATGRCLPSFLPYDTSPRAGGFVDCRFVSGVRPQEYFFHCMAGREGLIDTAVKTSTSGYLQRCIIKHLEGITVNYDLSVRESDGTVVQFQYGEDSLDICKTPFLNEDHLPFLIDNHRAIVDEDQLSRVSATMNTSAVKKKLKKMANFPVPDSSRKRVSPFLLYCASQDETYEDDEDGMEKIPGRSKRAARLESQFRDLSDKARRKWTKSCSEQMYDPLNSTLRPSTHFGCMSEQKLACLSDYMDSNPGGIITNEDADSPDSKNKSLSSGTGKISAERLRDMFYLKHVQSLVEPGEAVGLLAGQSIGEPSTQMTLNTFHHAGRGEMNVTLGIPRLREILIVASQKLRTPMMSVPILQSKHAQKRCKPLKKRLNQVYFSEVIHKMQVWKTFDAKRKCITCRVRFTFLPASAFNDRCLLTSDKIIKFVESHFIKGMAKDIATAFKAAASVNVLQNVQGTAGEEEEEAAVQSGKGWDGAHLRRSMVEGDGDDEEEEEAEDVKTANRRETKETDYDDRDSEVGEDVVDAALDAAQLDEESGIDTDEEKDGDSQTAAADKEGREEGQGDNESEAGAGCTTSLVGGLEVEKRSRTQKVEKVDVTSYAGRVLAVTNGFKAPRCGVSGVEEYSYDADESLWCEVVYILGSDAGKIDIGTIVEKAARATVLYQTQGVKRAFLDVAEGKKKKKKYHTLKTDGVNLRELYEFSDIVDVNRLYSNDVHAVANNYGIEAAYSTIIKECRDVFADYHIAVDFRHLSLIADYMVHDGVYKALNRYGMGTNASPLQKMTFETAMSFLTNAIITGAKDDLKSPSSRLVVGSLVNGGTGSFELAMA